jgi:hypothetical protein
MDIRWPNIVSVDSDWLLIDSEFAHKDGSPIPKELKSCDPHAAVCDHACDLYMIGQLVCDRLTSPDGTPLCDDAGRAFGRALMNARDQRLTAKVALKDKWLVE